MRSLKEHIRALRTLGKGQPGPHAGSDAYPGASFDIEKLNVAVRVRICEVDIDGRSPEPFTQHLWRGSKTRELLLSEVGLGEEELKMFFEKQAVVVAYQDDPPRSGPLDQERHALKTDFGELGL